MNTIISFFLQLALTILLAFLIVGYLRPFLHKILTDLCGTDERAQFWTAFSNILLIGMPVLLAMAYKPKAQTSEALFFEVAGKLSGNFGGLLFALVAVGVFVSFFALFSPKPAKPETR